MSSVAPALREEGGLLAAELTGEDLEGDFAVEAIREGELLHYRAPRVLAPPDDDLALLAGDRLYALGLERLAERGDLEAVAALADVISFSAQAHVEGREEVTDARFGEAARHIVDRAGVRSRTAP